jgi:hypothetical protein
MSPWIAVALIKSLKYASILLLASIALPSPFYILDGWKAYTNGIGYVILIEIMILFFMGGFMDFKESGTGLSLRNLFNSKNKQEYSKSRHADSQKKGAVLIMAGCWLFLIALIFTLF